MQSVTTVVAAVLVVAAGVALVPIREIASEPNDAEGTLSSVAFAAPFIAAGLIALLSVHRAKPSYSVAAGVALLPISLVAFILIPLLIPAMRLIAIGMTGATQSSNRDIGISIVVTVGLVAAFAALLVHQDPATWSTPTASGGSSDIVTTTEAILGLTIVGAVLLVAAIFGRSPNPHPRPTHPRSTWTRHPRSHMRVFGVEPRLSRIPLRRPGASASRSVYERARAPGCRPSLGAHLRRDPASAAL